MYISIIQKSTNITFTYLCIDIYRCYNYNVVLLKSEKHTCIIAVWVKC